MYSTQCMIMRNTIVPGDIVHFAGRSTLIVICNPDVIPAAWVLLQDHQYRLITIDKRLLFFVIAIRSVYALVLSFNSNSRIFGWIDVGDLIVMK